MERAAWLERRYGARIEWHPFDLHPEYPPEGITRASLAQRYGPGIEDHTRRLIEGAGFPYRPNPRVPRSEAALRLAELARSEGRHDAIHEALFRAYWSEGRDIGAVDVLLDVAAAAGLDRDKAAEVIASDAYAAEVQASTAVAHQIGVTGVPAWLLDGELLIPGAQPHAVFDQVLAQAGYKPIS